MTYAQLRNSSNKGELIGLFAKKLNGAIGAVNINYLRQDADFRIECLHTTPHAKDMGNWLRDHYTQNGCVVEKLEVKLDVVEMVLHAPNYPEGQYYINITTNYPHDGKNNHIRVTTTFM